MGRRMRQGDTVFFLPGDKKDAALEAVKALHGQETLHDGSGAHFSWVHPDFWKATTLERILRYWNFAPTVSKDGDVIDLEHTGAHVGDEKYLFEALAPFVRAGSHIIFHGEEGEAWRWWFDGTTVQYHVATLTFPDPVPPEPPPAWDRAKLEAGLATLVRAGTLSPMEARDIVALLTDPMEGLMIARATLGLRMAHVQPVLDATKETGDDNVR